MEKIEENIVKERTILNALKEKKKKIEEKITVSEKKIQNYTALIEQKKFSAVNDVLDATGLSLEEVMNAIKTGNIIALQEKIEKNKQTSEKT